MYYISFPLRRPLLLLPQSSQIVATAYHLQIIYDVAMIQELISNLYVLIKDPYTAGRYFTILMPKCLGLLNVAPFLCATLKIIWEDLGTRLILYHIHIAITV